MEFYFQSNSVMNSLKCPKSKSLSHCLTELFPIYQNEHWTIRRRDDCFVDPLSHGIILKIVGFLISLYIQRSKNSSKRTFVQTHFCAVLNDRIKLDQKHRLFSSQYPNKGAKCSCDTSFNDSF